MRGRIITYVVDGVKEFGGRERGDIITLFVFFLFFMVD